MFIFKIIFVLLLSIFSQRDFPLQKKVFVLSRDNFFQNQEITQEDNFKHKEKEKREKVELLRVVDGDTLIIKKDGIRERLRLIGMDAPESVKPKNPVECFGKEASRHMSALVHKKGNEALFQADLSQGKRDRFGRLLGYIFLDGTNLAEKMIRDGYAYEYTYRKDNPYQYQKIFQNAEREAKKEMRGLWAPGACKRRL